MHAMTRQSDTQRLQHRIMELARDKKSLETRCAALEAALNRIVAVDETITYLVVGEGKHAVLHSCSSTGAVKQLTTVCVTRAGESGYEQAWRDAPAVPTSPAAIVADVLSASEPPRDGMDCDRESSELAMEASVS